MTLQTTTIRILYGPFPPGGGPLSYAFPFRVLDSDHLIVSTIDAVGVTTTLVAGVDYTFSGIGALTGGTITLTAGSPPAEGAYLSIRRDVPLIQEIDLRNQATPAPQTIENGLDYVTMGLQQLADVIGAETADSRVLRLGDDDIDGLGSYRAKGNRIQDLGAPALGTDAARLDDVEAYFEGLSQGGTGRLPLYWEMTGDGATTVFAINGAPALAAVSYEVYIQGVRQAPITNYTIQYAAETITFGAAPAATAEILVVAWAYARGLVNDIPEYTTATRPTPDADAPELIRVVDVGQPERVQMRIRNASGVWSWETLLTGPW